jgi:hypothetical protein
LLHTATRQAGQRQICWPLPLSDGVITGSGAPAKVSTRSLSISALITKALPVSVWQLVQWQQWTNIGAELSR